MSNQKETIETRGGRLTGSNTSKEKIDAARSLDGLLVLLAFGIQVIRLSVQDVRVLWAVQSQHIIDGRLDLKKCLLDIDEGEEVLKHERVIRFRVVSRDSDVFILDGQPACLLRERLD